MSKDHTYYEVDVYVDSTGRYHLPLRWEPLIGRPTKYDFGSMEGEFTGYGVTVWRASHERDSVVFSRAYDALSNVGFDVKPPRGYAPTEPLGAPGREEAA